MMSLKRILIIEDDTDAASVLEAYLKRDNFQVLLASDGVGGLEMALRVKPDLILLDVMLPGLNGTEVLAALRRKSDVPVIMVTAMGDDTDKIGALRYGADDYVTKPYHPGEVVARVQAVLRRTSGVMTSDRTLSFGPLLVDQDAMLAAVTDTQGHSQPLELTPTEFSLLTTLLRAQTRAFSRQELLEACLPESDALERVVDTHIYNLRKKLEAVGISGVLLTVRAVGYRFRQP
jgi:DNA-binding response OmpR family regulator